MAEEQLRSPDPLDQVISEGRLSTRPVQTYGTLHVVDIDLDFLVTQIRDKMVIFFQNDHRIRIRYSTVTVDQQIYCDTTAMADYIGAIVYNCLRLTLEDKASRLACFERMKKRCPVPNTMEFPAWISSTLSCIGPYQTLDKLILYTTKADRYNDFGGPFSKIEFNFGGYSRLMGVLREIGVRMAPLDDRVKPTVSFYPTIDLLTSSDHIWIAYGTVHHSHYENEDFARIAFVADHQGRTPFGKSDDDVYRLFLLGSDICTTEIFAILRHRIMNTES